MKLIMKQMNHHQWFQDVESQSMDSGRRRLQVKHNFEDKLIYIEIYFITNHNHKYLVVQYYGKFQLDPRVCLSFLGIS